MDSVYIDLSPNHLGIARRACDAASKDPTQALVAVVFSAACFEAFLYSVVLSADRRARNDKDEIDPGVVALANVLPELERDNAQWALKLQAIFVLLTGKPIARGAQPFQDLHLLFQIRNAIVHSKLNWKAVPVDAEESDHHKFINELVSRRLIEHPRPIPALPGSEHEGRMLVGIVIESLLRKEVASWAVETVERAIRTVSRCPRDRVFSEQVRRYTGLSLFGGLQEMKLE
jgi:hypothetical protein